MEEPIGHVQAYFFSYDRYFDVILHRAAIGGQFTTYGGPDD
jgi:hypothetical protein